LPRRSGARSDVPENVTQDRNIRAMTPAETPLITLALDFLVTALWVDADGRAT
jgi:hypothetical protein